MAQCYPDLLIVGTTIGRTRLLVLVVRVLIGIGTHVITVVVHADEHAMVFQDVTVIPTHWRHIGRHLVDIPQQLLVAVVTVASVIAVEVEDRVPAGSTLGATRTDLTAFPRHRGHVMPPEMPPS
jgi:hypothetical protein